MANPSGMSDPLISRHDQTETIPTGQRVVVFQCQTKDSIVLNPTGSWLWNQLDQPRRVSWLVQALSQECPGVSKETIQGDIESYIDQMVENQVFVQRD